MKFQRKVADVVACSFNSWYPYFSKLTMDSVWLPVPEEVAAYARSGGTIVSAGGARADPNSDDDDDSVDWEAAEEEGPELQRPEFPAFDAAVRAALVSLGAEAAFIKLNWSAPVDVRWLSVGRALRSHSPDDVIVLLRSSTRLQRDLCHPFEDCVDVDGDGASVVPQLVLRSWVDISPAAEFRCFVRERQLVAISQREISQFFPHLLRDAADVVTDISSFFKEKIQHKFSLQNYVFDVYRPTKDRVRLVDFSPLSPPTDPALFTWHQLHGANCLRCGEPPGDDTPLCEECVREGASLPIFQKIADADAIQRAPYAEAELPYDVTAMAAANDTAAIVELLRKSQLRQAEDSSGDDEK